MNVKLSPLPEGKSEMEVIWKQNSGENI